MQEEVLGLKKGAEYMQPELLTDKEIIGLLQVSDEVITWLKSVQEYALKKALNGVRFEGYKLVEGRSNRVITDPAKAIDILEEKGFPRTSTTETSLLSLTNLENLVGKKSLGEYLGELINKPKGKLSLVPATDKKPEVNINPVESAKSDFAGII